MAQEITKENVVEFLNHASEILDKLKRPHYGYIPLDVLRMKPISKLEGLNDERC